MTCIVGASASCAKVPFCEKWVGCISHQLNTAMKHVMAAEETNKTRVGADLSSVKVLVRVFKHGDWNATMPPGMALVQEVETRFGTTHAVAERFVKAFHTVRAVVNEKQQPASAKALQSLLDEKSTSGELCLPAIKAIVGTFGPVCHVQTALEASGKPNVHVVLPMLEHIRVQLSQKAAGMVRSSSTMTTPHFMTRKLCSALVLEFETIQTHDYWVAAPIMHSGLRNLSFIPKMSERQVLRNAGCSMIRRPMVLFKEKECGVCVTERERIITPNQLGDESVHLTLAMRTTTNSLNI